MRPASLITIVVAVAAVVVAAMVARGHSSSSSSDSPVVPKRALQLDMRVSPEKEALLKPLVRQFNASGARAAGKRVFVVMRAENSGDTESRDRRAAPEARRVVAGGLALGPAAQLRGRQALRG